MSAGFLRHRESVLPVLALLTLLPLQAQATPRASAQGPRLNAPFPPDAIGSVRAFALSPSGARVAYAADQESYGALELYNAPADGNGAAIALAAPALPAATTLGLTVSPDGLRLVYRSNAAGPSRFELFGVAMDGSGIAVGLSGMLVSGGSVEEYVVGPTHVVYLADALADGVRELFSAPLDGSAAPTRLSGTLVAGGNVSSFALSPDGTRVVYTADQAIGGVKELHGVPVDGSAAALRLHPALPANRTVFSVFTPFSPDSSRVVYVADQNVNDAFELFSVPANGSASPIRLCAAFPNGRLVTNVKVGLTGRVVYRADQTSDDVYELYSAPIDGSAAAVKLNGPLVANGDVNPYFQISPDGQRVLYSADELVDGLAELFSAPTDGSAARVKLNGALPPGSGIPFGFQIDASSQRAAYLVYTSGGSGLELHGVPSDGSAATVRLDPPLLAGQVLLDFALAANGRALYRRRTTDLLSPFTITDDMFSVPLDASAAPVELSRSMPGDLLEPPTPDAAGARALFFAHRAAGPGELASANELQSAPTTGGHDPVRLHPELALGPSARDVHSFQHSPDGRWVVYLADQDVEGALELFCVRSDGTSAPFKLNAPTDGLSILASTIGPDSVHAVYRSQADARLYRTTLDGSAAPLALTPPGAAEEPQFTADGQQLVYALTGRAYRVALDGSGSPLELLGTLVPGGGLASNTLPLACTSPDSTRFFFVADKDTDDVFELYGVPLDGSATPTKLSGALVAGGDVLGSSNVYFRTSPDGTRLVFVADKDVDGVTEVYSVPADGSAAPIELSGAMTAGGDAALIAQGLAISPDSTRVVYLADQLVDERFELFSAPLDGSSPAVRINGILVAGGDVAALSGMPFVISPDSTRVVYRADQDFNDRFELYVAPLDGSGPSTKLGGPIDPSGDVLSFALNGDGAHALYSASGPVDGAPTLFIVPLDGSAAPLDLSGPRGVSSFLPSPDGSGVAYVAASTVEPANHGLYWVRSDGARTLVLGSYPSQEYEFHPEATRVVHRSNLQGRQELWLRYVQRVPRTRGF